MEIHTPLACSVNQVVCCAAAELIVSAFQHYVSLRGPILEEAVASMLPNLDCQQCIYPVGMLHIHVASALIVQLLQVLGQPAVHHIMCA